jgi:hypothetical protein
LKPMSIKKTTMFIIWLVVSNMNFIFHFIKKGCHPSHWRTHIVQRGRSTTNQYIYILIVILHTVDGRNPAPVGNYWEL